MCNIAGDFSINGVPSLRQVGLNTQKGCFELKDTHGELPREIEDWDPQLRGDGCIFWLRGTVDPKIVYREGSCFCFDRTDLRHENIFSTIPFAN